MISRRKVTQKALPLVIIGPDGEEVIRDGTPNICCHMLDYVLEQEKPLARTGLHRPLLTFSHAPGNKLNPKGASKELLYRATGRKAHTIFLNFCPFCGGKFGTVK